MLDRLKFWQSADDADEVIAYAYRVVPNEPDWRDADRAGPAFEPHRSVTFEHPADRFEGIDGAEAEDVTALVAKQ